MDIIIGAGITGLSYAMFSKNNDYLILEADNQIGGYCKTIKRNGFVWDYSGHFFHFQNPEIESLVMENIDKSQLITAVKDTKIWYKGNMIEYPFQKNIDQLPKDEFIDCLYDLFNNPQKSYSNFKEMLYSKFGKSIAEKFLIPYNTKLYATDLNRLDKDAMGRFFPYADKLQIIKNFKERDNQSYNATFVYPKGGAIMYVNSIASRLDASKIRTNSKVVGIDVARHVVTLNNGEQLHYDRLVSTLPFNQLMDLCGMTYDKKIYSWNQVLVFNLGFDSKGPNTQQHWIYFPEKDYAFYRVGFYDNIIGSDRTSLYVELGFAKDEIVNPNEYLGRVLKDLVKAKVISSEQTLVDYETILMNPAYVHITQNSITDVIEKKTELKRNDVYSIGRYGSWTYCSIEDNVKEAKKLAEE